MDEKIVPKQDTSNSISPDMLNPVTPLKLPENQPDTTASKFMSEMGQESAIAKETRQNAEKAKTDKSSSLTDIEKLMNDVAGVSAKENTYATDLGADKLKKQSDDLQSAIDVETKALSDTIDNLYKNPNLTMGLAGKIATEEQRKSASYTANLALTQSIINKNYDRANSIAKKKVEVELAPIKAKLEAKKFVYEANKDSWTASEKALLDSRIKSDDREYEKKKKELETIEEIKINAFKWGLKDTSAFDGVTTVGEALKSAGKYVTDPLERELKQAQIDSANRANKPSGGDAPTIKTINGVDMQWDGTKWIPPMGASASTQNEATRLTLEDKLKNIDALKVHSGLKSSVGTNPLARTPIISEFTGERQDFIAGVEQLVSQDTLNTLLELKKAGGTLGALSNEERIMLKNSATKIGNWADIRDDKVIGYNASEKSFKAELDVIRTLTARAIEQAGGSVSESNDYLNQVDGALQVTNNPYVQAGYDLKK